MWHCVVEQGSGCGIVWQIKEVGVADQRSGCGRSKKWVWQIKEVGVADQGSGCGTVMERGSGCGTVRWSKEVGVALCDGARKWV